MRDSQGILLVFDRNTALKILANESGERMKYVSGPAKEQLGLRTVLIRPDGIIARLFDSAPNEQIIRQAAARWFAR